MTLGNWTVGQIVSISYGEYDSSFNGSFVVLKDVNLDEFMLAHAKKQGDYAWAIDQELMNAGIVAHLKHDAWLDCGIHAEVSDTTSSNGGIDQSKVTEVVYGANDKAGTFADLLAEVSPKTKMSVFDRLMSD